MSGKPMRAPRARPRPRRRLLCRSTRHRNAGPFGEAFGGNLVPRRMTSAGSAGIPARSTRSTNSGSRRSPIPATASAPARRIARTSRSRCGHGAAAMRQQATSGGRTNGVSRSTFRARRLADRALARAISRRGAYGRLPRRRRRGGWTFAGGPFTPRLAPTRRRPRRRRRRSACDAKARRRPAPDVR